MPEPQRLIDLSLKRLDDEVSSQTARLAALQDYLDEDAGTLQDLDDRVERTLARLTVLLEGERQ